MLVMELRVWLPSPSLFNVRWWEHKRIQKAIEPRAAPDRRHRRRSHAFGLARLILLVASPCTLPTTTTATGSPARSGRHRSVVADDGEEAPASGLRTQPSRRRARRLEAFVAAFAAASTRAAPFRASGATAGWSTVFDPRCQPYYEPRQQGHVGGRRPRRRRGSRQRRTRPTPTAATRHALGLRIRGVRLGLAAERQPTTRPCRCRGDGR